MSHPIPPDDPPPYGGYAPPPGYSPAPGYQAQQYPPQYGAPPVPGYPQQYPPQPYPAQHYPPQPYPAQQYPHQPYPPQYAAPAPQIVIQNNTSAMAFAHGYGLRKRNSVGVHILLALFTYGLGNIVYAWYVYDWNRRRGL
ncbi:hypothetical protein GCM10010168_64760 [Actinoplanes ianthinogenes]|uniref:DUF8108 domain-containing protein n=1 Tax=Actinoplanes ianthinogenes TaxID=122358 RepID=A0ABN6CCU3_9ACTN|nr:hypothetical protein [Actinoplanes ianthinogenes]BCJ42146.1 hypothetical protein Aiant_28030 [Actinoplanes ianthinogenes]GGR37412.1 hypothetical protein GCM10010168_64760 [Actinoplanes ianthinogenes]